jgi:hypothetical protein
VTLALQLADVPIGPSQPGGATGLRWLRDAELPAPCLATEPMLVIASAGPLPLDCALAGLERQSDLRVPVKFTRSASGVCELRAEVPDDGARERCAADARAALDGALTALASDVGQRSGRASPPAATRIGEVLEQLGWNAAREESGGYRIHAPAGGTATRLVAYPLRAGGVHVTASTLVIRTAGGRSARALALFALEANGRFRLARLTVSASDGVARAGWDAVLPAAAVCADGLATAVEALFVARTETERALRALAKAAVADAYLEARDPQPLSRARSADGSTYKPA